MRLEEWKQLYERVKPRFDFSRAAAAFEETKRNDNVVIEFLMHVNLTRRAE